MTFEKTKIQVLIEEHSRMPLDHHNLPTAAKDCPLCKKATMTTEEKKRTYKQTLALVKKMQKKLSAPPETEREWEKDFIEQLHNPKSNYSDKDRWMVDYVKALIASALAQGEKIGAEKALEIIDWEKAHHYLECNPKVSMVNHIRDKINALKGTL